MWKKIKENWKTYLLLILSALFGADQVEELGLLPATPDPAPASYEATVADNWTVVAWFTLEKECGGGATPAHACPDVLGRYTVFVDSGEEPTDKEIVYALYGERPPGKVTVDKVEVIPPRRRKQAPENPADKK